LSGRERIALALGLKILVGEQQLAPGLAHVPLDVVGEHVHEDVGAHARLEPMVDRADLQVHRLEGAKSAFHPAERFVATHRLGRRQLLLRHARA
jgi:hypothetical protein